MRWNVTIANAHQHVKIVGAHRTGPRMNFVAQINAQFVGVVPDFGCFFHEALLAFLDEIKIGRASCRERV